MYNRLHSYSVHVFRNAGSARVVAGRPSESHDAESDSTSMTRMMSNQSPDPTARATIGDITSRGDMPAEPEYSSREVDLATFIGCAYIEQVFVENPMDGSVNYRTGNMGMVDFAVRAATFLT